MGKGKCNCCVLYVYDLNITVLLFNCYSANIIFVSHRDISNKYMLCQFMAIHKFVSVAFVFIWFIINFTAEFAT